MQRASDIFGALYRSYGKMCGEESLRFQNRKCQLPRRATRRSFRVAAESLLPAGSRYVERGFRRSARKSADRKFDPKVVSDQSERISKTSTAACLSHQSCTELGLPSRTPQKDDHHLCAPPRSSSTKARDRSIPAVTPAEVKTFLSLI